MTHLLITVNFHDARFHGLLDRGGPPEWPPSPFRLFSALVAGVARRGELDGEMGQSLALLQKLDPPIIIAPKARTGQPITRFVPNNDGDKKPDRQERLTAKPTIPTLMLLGPDEKPQVHYLWSIAGRTNASLSRIRDAARSLTALGWGVDMAFADAMPIAESEIQSLPGVRWIPKRDVWRTEGMLRVPKADANLQECTLCDLKHCYETAINRIEHGSPLHTVDTPRVFDQVFYGSAERPIGRPFAIFELRHDDDSFCRYAQHKLIHIAGMLRHLAKKVMDKSLPPDVNGEWVERYVVGHRDQNSTDHRQFSYLPLPSINHPQADQAVRRVMIAAPLGDDRFLEHLAHRLEGQQLVPERGNEFGKQGPPTLIRVYRDNVARRYTAEAHRWASVTPVILPGHDDRKPEKTRKLIETALVQSGIEQQCEFEWSPLSCFPKSLSAHKHDKGTKLVGYLRPGHLLTKSVVHLTLRFKHDVLVAGPIAIGAGRHCGLGVFAALH